MEAPQRGHEDLTKVTQLIKGREREREKHCISSFHFIVAESMRKAERINQNVSVWQM